MRAYTASGYHSTDRLICAAITRDGAVHLIGPAFERPAFDNTTFVAQVHTWEEHEDPYAMLAEILRRDGAGAGRVGVDGRMWLEAVKRFRTCFADCTVESAEPLLREVRICAKRTGMASASFTCSRS
jgi:Xaa-Pro dipeptidase